MKILFMGTPDFAVPCLEALVKSGYDICGAVTQPDKPKGRGRKMAPPPVKACAADENIPVFQPESLKDYAFMPVLEETQPEMIVVVAYGKILPEYILNYPKYGCINVHASLLPKYRGAAPIQWSVINGEKKTGVTTMYMEKGLDTGDMIYKSETDIRSGETYGELHDRLSAMGADIILKTVSAIEKGEAPREKQDDALSNYAPMISRETGRIDWNKSAGEVLNLIRGMNPYPMCYTLYGEEVLKIINAYPGTEKDGEPGSISVKKNCIEVVCGDKRTVCIDEIQFKGGKRMSVSSYLNGHTINEDVRFV